MSNVTNQVQGHLPETLRQARSEAGVANGQNENAATEPSSDLLTESTQVEESVVHESTLFAEPIFHIGSFTVTNALLTSWIAVAIIICLFTLLRRRAKLIPRGIQNIVEIVLESVFDLMDSVTSSRSKSLKLFPLVFGLFVFILANNWMGLLPGVGSIGFIIAEHGEKVFVPLLRGGTADLNTTLALAILAVFATHIIGIITIGAWNHFNKFISLKLLLEIPKKIWHDPTIIFINPIKFFVGIVELIGEIAKVASLSFRLFGNVFAGEVLLVSISAMIAFVAPIPFIFLELIVGVVQALVFSMLTLVFATIAMAHEH